MVCEFVAAAATTRTSVEEDEDGETDFASAMGNRSLSVIGACRLFLPFKYYYSLLKLENNLVLSSSLHIRNVVNALTVP